MLDLFQTTLKSLQLKESAVSITTADDTVFIATQNCIYSINNTTNSSLTKVFITASRIKEIHSLPDIHILIIIFDDRIELRNLNDINNESSEQFQVLSMQSIRINIWNNLNSNHLISNDSNSDLLSLATAVVDTKEINNTQTESLITYLSILSKSQIIILKYNNSKFIDRYNLYIPNIKHLQFININELVCLSDTKPNDLVHINLESSKISHHDISKILNLKTSYMKFTNSNQLSNIYYFNNQLIMLKYDEFINLNYVTNERNLSIRITNSNFKSSIIIFPFIFLLFDTCLEIRSVSNFTLFQTIAINSIIYLNFHDFVLSILSRDKVLIMKMISYNEILSNLYLLKDYDNAILLLENLNILNFMDNDDHNDHSDDHRNDKNLKQLKFIKLRKFKLLKAISLLNNFKSMTEFAKSIDLLTEYLASPKYVISNLPIELKKIIETDNQNEDEQSTENNLPTLEKFQINQLIRYLTDSRRKLQKLLDNKYTVFNYNNLEISLSIYQDDYSEFSILDNLKLLDDYLFKCYVLVNIKMINPFIRIQNYCDFSLVESKLKDLKLVDQLVNFYYSRGDFEKSVNLLIEKKNENHDDEKTEKDKNYDDDLVKYFQKLIQIENPPIDLIFSNLKNLKNYSHCFKSIFLNDNLNYSHVDYNKIIENLKNFNDKNEFIKYLEYLVFHLKITTAEIAQELFNSYFNDITKNYSKIEDLYKYSGNLNSNLILKQLKTLPISEQSKRLMIVPLMRLGKYDDILDIFVFDLNDIKGSIDFTLEVKRIKNDSLSRGLIFKILDLCLKNKDYSSIINYILNNSELDFINFEEILIKLPHEMSVNLMSSFLIMNLKNLNSINHNFIIKNELLKANVINIKLNKMNLERKMVKLTSNSICIKCGKFFNKSEILCFQPNGNILHYKCSKNSPTSTLSIPSSLQP